MGCVPDGKLGNSATILQIGYMCNHCILQIGLMWIHWRDFTINALEQQLYLDKIT